MERYTVMIPAAGSGQRMGAGMNKLFLKLDGKPILIHTLEVFENDASCSNIILSIKESERTVIESMLNRFSISKVVALVEGGNERQQSVAACLRAYEGNGVVLVHDAARPFIEHEVIGKLVEVASVHGAAVAGVPVKDTIKIVEDGMVAETVERSKLWSIQTPQAFRYAILKEASDKAEAEGFLGTDESMIVERLGYSVRIVEGTYENVKMTTKEDIVFGEALLRQGR
ncbi:MULTISPECIES: 2-C-methyl-D-erythritol 4-phosphate cytidylyltransferase [Sporosarcina]|uniref:2-C-methyl-D-erythritol 4-phosphate cytidylyltransferase n=1 Tax=Sporosarcina contaminans TaxID=633403 RepID=A0ABW3U1Z8_9BACL